MTLARAILDPDSLPTMGRRWDLASLALLAALLVFGPAAFGAVEAWSQLIVVAIVVALALVVAVRPAFDPEFRPTASWLYVPLALFLLLIAWELIPLPIGLARLLAPGAVATRTELLGEAAPLDDTTLSYYPLATAELLRLLLVGTSVFLCVASVFRRPRQIKELLLVIFAVGCAEAILTVAQIVTASHLIYWRFPPGADRIVTSGSFVNYSHFCQFMNLSLAAGVAFLLIRLHELRRHDRHTSFQRGALARVNWEQHGWIFCGIVLSAITVFTSMSRNGAISLLVAAAVVGTLLYRRGTLSWRGWLLGLLPISVLAGLLIFGFDAVYERLATLRESSAYASRWEMTAGAIRAWLANPLWGTGLGTHEYVFPMFDHSVSADVAVHADNDYAQLLEETGLLGALLVATFIIGLAMLAAKLALRGRTPVAMGAFGLSLGLLAVAIHSGSDFGQRVPSNLVLSATFCGLLVSIGRIEARDRLLRHGKIEAAPIGSPYKSRLVAVAMSLAVLLLGAWALAGGYAAFLGERWWTAALAMDSYIQRIRTEADDQDYIDLLAAAEGACQAEPTNVKYAYGLDVYRWQSLSRAFEPEAGEMAVLAEAVPLVERIADDLNRVRALCPTYGPPYALEGQLRLFVLGQPRGAELIRTGFRLAPYDPPTCLLAGELAARDGQFEQAQMLLERAVRLRPGYYREVVRLYLTELKRPDLARALAGDDFWRLNDLANVSAQHPDYAHLAEALHDEATDSLRRHAQSPDVPARDLAALASIDRQQGDWQSAVELYRRALSQEYNQIDWRLRLAETLAAAGQIDDAIHEVRICLRLRPQHPSATATLDKLLSAAKSNE